MTFGTYAAQRGVSRPYISKLKADGVLYGRAFTADGKIDPAIADQQIADARQRDAASKADRARAGTLASERLGKLRADRQRVEMENQVRRGDLIDRASLSNLAALARAYRDALKHAVRDGIDQRKPSPVVLAEMDDRTEQFIAEIQSHGGAPPPVA